MPVPSFTITCTLNKKIAQDVYELRFTKPHDLNFKAGQFLLFDVPAINDKEDIQTRAYSIASSPEEDDLLFVIKLIEGGRASYWFEHTVEEGTEVRIQGPFGVFTFDEESDKDALLVATSTGIAPFRSQLHSLVSQNFSGTIDILFGVRTKKDLFWVEELERIAGDYPNISLHTTLTGESQDWDGLTGRVQTVVPEIVSDFSNLKLYACGNPAMTTEIKKLALEEWGMEKKDVHVEGYI